MMFFQCFVSIIFVIRNSSEQLETILKNITQVVSPLVSDYEIIIVDNASKDNSIETLKKLTGEKGIPNIQVYTLTQEISYDMAIWVGLENALGDFMAVIDPNMDDITFLPEMLKAATEGNEVVFAANTKLLPKNLWYKISSFLFKGIQLNTEAPRYRLLSKRVVNFILQHPLSSFTYRSLPATAGFSKKTLTYTSSLNFSHVEKKSLIYQIIEGIGLLVSTTQKPMRIVTALSLFGAFSNLIYSVYVIVVHIMNADVAPGWATLSLQQSGMFFLFSLVFLIIGEYLLQVSNLTNQRPMYHISQEFCSSIITRKNKLNIEEK